MKIKDPEPNFWLKKRGEMYETLAESSFISAKNVEFHFANPDSGWAGMSIKFDGEIW